jgi:hypothetical protein
MKATAVMIPSWSPNAPPGSCGRLRHARLDDRDDRPQDDAGDDRQDRDGRVLAPDERDGTFEDGGGDVLHRLRTLVPGQDVPGEPQRVEHGSDARDRDDQLK